MKKLNIFLVFVIATFTSMQIFAQSTTSTVCLPASQDTQIHEFAPTTNYGTNPVIRASRHTYNDAGGSGFYTTKVLTQFDISTLPVGVTISSAIMKLHVDATDVVYNKHYDLGGAGNGATIEPVGTAWNESSVTWTTAPSVLPSAVTIPSLGNGSTADVIVDVTTMVQNMIITGINNGFQISLTDNTDYYHGLVMGSKENTSAGGIYKPELCVTYSLPCDEWSLCGNTTTATDFLGTINNQPLNFKTNNTQRMTLDYAGRLSISNAGISTYQKLYVETAAQNDGIQVNQTGTTAATLDLNASGGAGKRWALHSTGSGNSQGAGHLLFWDWTTNQERMRINEDGKVRIGNMANLPSGYKLFVEEGILTEKVKVAVVNSGAWADYVFAADYNLKPLSEVEAFIKENKHLPNVPSADELVKDGLDLGKMQATQMEKIEELTLYIIEMKKEIEMLKNQIAK
ncbi:DNRLRE domain-containing protein [Flavobacterium sp.]|jgi:hypothetical protein|uniref:DNRLRE domain-containing protein n=1 Tax=Flavobacterium sp. TaxID=239 RepID=UPI0037C168ED